VREEVPDTVAALRAAGITAVLVTGDDPRAAAHVGAQLGIERVHGGVLPDGKAELIRSLQADGTRVVMVGDGINDAPALMQADVGVAMGHGTDIAIESADVIALHHHLGTVLAAHRISRTAYRRTKQNVALAFVFNGVGIPLAATGLVYPVWAMVAMAASVTTIFVNSIGVGVRPTLLFATIASVGRHPGAGASREPAR
jgi:P-type E1-E2 ATPase